MRRFCTLIGVLVATSCAGFGQTEKSCAQFQQLVKRTYNFKESNLSVAQKMAKEKTLNQFWETVEKRRKEFLPCLRTSLQNTKADPFFRFDGSNLLVHIDPSTASKALQVQIYTATPLDTAGAQRWLSVLVARGYEGHDVSQAAKRWLSDPKAAYTLPEHGDFEVDNLTGALFLLGAWTKPKPRLLLSKSLARKISPCANRRCGC